MKEKTNKGITLIALVITIIVLLILAAVSIAMLTGENGILTNASKAKVENAHGAVKEAIRLENSNYNLEKKTRKRTNTLIEYFQEKEIIGEPEEEGKYVINVEKLLGTKPTLGLGTDGKDVYKLEEVTEEPTTGKLGKIASTKVVKVAETTSTGKTYKVMYYGKTASEDIEITTLTEGTSQASNQPQKQFGESFTFHIKYQHWNNQWEPYTSDYTALEGMTWKDWFESEYSSNRGELRVLDSDDVVFWGGHRACYG